MIGFLPPIYEDELFYSWLNRYYAKSGYKLFQNALDDFFVKDESTSLEFFAHLKDDALERITHVLSMDDFITKHTMFPLFAPFLCASRRTVAYNILKNNQGDIYMLFPKPKKRIRAKYCPLCVVDDEKDLGEAFIHRKHQIRGINVCYKHGCLLENSSIALFSYTPPRLFKFNEDINKNAINNTSLQYGNANEIALTRFLAHLMDEPIDLGDTTTLSDFLLLDLEDKSFLSINDKEVKIIWSILDNQLFPKVKSACEKKIALSKRITYNTIEKELEMPYGMLSKSSYRFPLCIHEIAKYTKGRF